MAADLLRELAARTENAPEPEALAASRAPWRTSTPRGIAATHSWSDTSQQIWRRSRRCLAAPWSTPYPRTGVGALSKL
jgi:hypothetical protein